MKKLILIIIFALNIMANIDFKETNIIAAIPDYEKVQYGSMDFSDDLIILSYTKPNLQTITYDKEKVSINTNEEIKEYYFEQYPKIEFIGLITKALITNSFETLDELFIKTIEQGDTILSAKPILRNVIDYIKIQYTKENKVNIITIYMENEDIRTIEIIH